MSSDIANLEQAALECRRIAQQATALLETAEQVIGVSASNSLTTDNYDELVTAARLFDAQAARYGAAVAAARDVDHANPGNVGRNLGWSGNPE